MLWKITVSWVTENEIGEEVTDSTVVTVEADDLAEAGRKARAKAAEYLENEVWGGPGAVPEAMNIIHVEVVN